MAGGHQHQLFFRFRSATGLIHWQGVYRAHWLFDSLRFIDIDENDIVDEYIVCNMTARGFMTLADARSIRYPRAAAIAAEMKRMRAASAAHGAEGMDG